MARKNSKHLLPGFGLTMGISLFYITLVILLPIAAMLLKVAGMGLPEFWRIISSRRAIAAYQITFSSAFYATMLNGTVGLLLAWVLTRYRFPGRRILDALVDLPFALPTASMRVPFLTLPIFLPLVSGLARTLASFMARYRPLYGLRSKLLNISLVLEEADCAQATGADRTTSTSPAESAQCKRVAGFAMLLDP